MLQPVPVETVQAFLCEVHPKGDPQHGNDGVEQAHCQDHRPSLSPCHQKVGFNFQAGRKKHHKYQQGHYLCCSGLVQLLLFIEVKMMVPVVLDDEIKPNGNEQSRNDPTV
ncbi:hypothetical protein [Echinicola rosea]|uniref:hypothetical protein n=1 Tax=Echinicola rosea TaxID=1807691 RepID=UPI0010CA7E24|nr:hypothetical protein [Echinicola rosea]